MQTVNLIPLHLYTFTLFLQPIPGSADHTRRHSSPLLFPAERHGEHEAAAAGTAGPRALREQAGSHGTRYSAAARSPDMHRTGELGRCGGRDGSFKYFLILIVAMFLDLFLLEIHLIRCSNNLFFSVLFIMHLLSWI